MNEELLEQTEYPPIEIAKLSVGTTLLIQTQDEEVYEFTIMNPKKNTVYVTGGKLCPQGIDAVITSSFWEEEYDKRQVGIIQKGLCIELKIPNPELKNKSHLVSTTPVQTAKITGPDNLWSFEMWGDNQ